jgi:phage-related minor tail protein
MMAEVVILVKTYPGGRPNSFEMVNADNQEGIDQLVEGFGYSVVETREIPQGFDPWEEYTTEDADGFTQWK